MKAAFTETGLTLFLAAAGDHDQGDGEAEGASGEQQQQAFASGQTGLLCQCQCRVITGQIAGLAFQIVGKDTDGNPFQISSRP